MKSRSAQNGFRTYEKPSSPFISIGFVVTFAHYANAPSVDYTTLYQPLPLTIGTILALLGWFLPLISFGLLMPQGRHHRELFAWLATGLTLAATIASLLVLQQVWTVGDLHCRTIWFQVPGLHITYPFTVGLLITRVSALMMVVVTTVSSLVHLYSIAYMRGDPRYLRYFAYLGLFTFAMLGVTLADNLLMIFFFWEIMGVASYALIGFWHQDPRAIQASTKAFLMNRIGDTGFLIGLMILWSHFGTLDLLVLENLMRQSVLSTDGEWLSYFRVNGLTIENASPAHWLTLAGVGLFLGAAGKSAQLPLQTWLPDAMAGPTPASALIHAATMVAAGVYLLVRVFVLLTPTTLTIIAYAGAITALMAAVAALTQYDIKRVLAFSTISQLGYMMMGIGVGNDTAAFFHLVTHASFKACLFLAAGSVIQNMHRAKYQLPEGSRDALNAQDIRWMGGLQSRMPVTFAAYLIAAASLVGLPFFSGFLSKDAIIAASLAWGVGGTSVGPWLVPAAGLLTALLTAVYMSRQVVLIFFGDLRIATLWPQRSLSHGLRDPSWLMLVPLIVLAVLSLGLVYSPNPIDETRSWLVQAIVTPPLAVPGSTGGYEQIPRSAHQWQFIASWAVSALALLGIGIAYARYRTVYQKKRSYLFSRRNPSILRQWSLHHGWLDAIYQRVIVNPVLYLARSFANLDRRVVDRAVESLAVMGVVLSHLVAWFDRQWVDRSVNTIAGGAGQLGRLARSGQTGSIQTYYVATLLVFLVFLYWLLV